MKAIVGQELLDDDLGLVQLVGEGKTASMFVVKNLKGRGNDVVRNASVLAILPGDAESNGVTEPTYPIRRGVCRWEYRGSCVVEAYKGMMEDEAK
eukprot:6171880-Pleurochrysis_carterae.AAC.4